MNPSDRTQALLADMQSFVSELHALLADQTPEALAGNRLLSLAAERLFINLGEAASRVAPSERERLPQLPWRRLIGMRNVLAHGYDVVSAAVLVDTARHSLPPLDEALRALLNPPR